MASPVEQAVAPWRRRSVVAIAGLASLRLAVCVVILAQTLACHSAPEVSLPGDQKAADSSVRRNSSDKPLRVLTLNLGHGRGDRGHQLFQGRENIEHHLDQVAEQIRRINPDLVALQEADSASRWSGGFDHVAYLADRIGMPHRFAGIHSQSPIFRYGTALLSKVPLIDPQSVSFAPSFPTFTKGYVWATLAWPDPQVPQEGLHVISMHLDYSRAAVRRKQAQQLIDDLSESDRPLILLGDFNATWGDENSVVRYLAQELELRAVEASGGEATFPRLDSRLDWILISDDLQFERHRVENELVSDHRTVWAEVDRK